MSIRRFVAAGVALSLTAPLLGVGNASASTPVDPVISGAKTWLVTQQQADGGFDVSGFAGFETPDAVLALAAAFQTGSTWDAAGALASIQALDNGTGKDPLDDLDDLAESSLVTANPEDDPTNNAGAARAAKLIALNGAPLGIPATDFDPSGDSAEPVDLLAVLNAHRAVDGSYDLGALFNGVLYTAVALEVTGNEVPLKLAEQIIAGQRPDGSWDYTGTPAAGPGGDIDTTSLALSALRSAGLGVADQPVKIGVQFLAARQQPSGAWQAYGADDPNSTATASLALSDLLVDVTTSGWRNSFGAPVTGTYVSPYTWLRAQQATDGHIISGNDGWGINTFATVQGMQALSRQWMVADGRQALIEGWSLDLASPAAAQTTGFSNELASDVLGPNPSTKAARVAAATAVVNGQDGRVAAATDLFKQAFNRTIDPSGRTYWSNKLTTISRPEMLSRLTGSSEFYRKAGGTTPTFVDAVYQSVLGRSADPSGRAYWIKRLNDGRSVEGVARSLVASSEYRRRQVNTVFPRILGRAANTGERDYWTTKIATTRIEVLMATLGGSLEFYELASA